jgi:hypothetical protein
MPSVSAINIPVTVDLTKALIDLHRLVSRIENVGVAAQKTQSSLKAMLKGLGAVTAAGAAVGLFGAKTAKGGLLDAFDFVTQAEGLGLTTEAFGKLKLAALEVGLSTDEMVRFFQRMDVALGNATLTADRAQKKFSGFLDKPSQGAQAFHRLGLDAEKLAQLPLDQRFEAVSKAILGLPSDSDRLKALQTVFQNVGRGGAVRDLALMKHYLEDIEGLSRRAKDVGFTLTDRQVEGIKRGRAALGDLSALWQGLKIQLGAEAAPLFAQGGKALLEWVHEMGGLPGIMERAFDSFHKIKMDAEDFGDILISSVGAFGKLWASFQFGFGKMLSLALPESRQGAVKEFMDEAVRMYTASDDATRRIFDRLEQRRKDAVEQWRKEHPLQVALGTLLRGPNVVRIDLKRTELSDAFKDRLRRTIRPSDIVEADVSRLMGRDFKETEALRQLARFRLQEFLGQNALGRGANSPIIALLDSTRWGSVARFAGLFARELEKAGNAAKTLSDLGKADLWRQQADLIRQEVLSPLGELAFMLNQVGQAQSIGGLDQLSADLKLFRVFMDLENKSGVNTINLAPAAQFGSAQAASIISNFEVRPTQDVQVRIATTLERMRDLQEQLNVVAGKVAAALRGSGVINGGR